MAKFLGTIKNSELYLSKAYFWQEAKRLTLKGRHGEALHAVIAHEAISRLIESIPPKKS